ncbi:MAG: alkaline phosphatase family protein, partial [Chloroflexota bacterium]|nr:alkaline phosphatase family protein [Chloroflexota bacterium]
MARATRALMVVLDGLRPDLVGPELTPTLARLVAEGVWFERGHAVVPTVTRVNSATLATGTLPAIHGLPANLLFAPDVDAAPLSLGEADTVPRLMGAYGVFGAPTLADIVADAGGSTALVSSGTRGSALMLDPRRAERGHLTLHPTLSTADELAQATDRVGPLPEAGVPDSDRNRWLTRAIVDWVVPELRPDLLMVWFNDPDKSQHRYGFGHPESLRAIRAGDADLALILDALDEAGVREETVVAVASDHGYASVRRHVDLAGRLSAAGLDRTGDGRPIVVAQNGCAVLVYAPGGTDLEIARIADTLLSYPEVDVLFSGGTGRPTIDGTFLLDRIGVGGPLAPELLVTLAWDDEPN